MPPGRVDLAQCNQLVEHSHPDDAIAQLKAITLPLAPDGRYVCVSPHRFTGPRDISKYLDLTATGFHLTEYTVGELKRMMRSAVFHHVHFFVRARGYSPRVIPARVVILLEALLEPLPQRARRRIARSLLRVLPRLAVIATN